MYQREHFFRLVKNGLEVVFSLISENQNAETLQFDLSKCERIKIEYTSPSFVGVKTLTTQKYGGNYYEIVGENKIKIVLSNLHNAPYLLNGVAFYGSYTLSICSLQIDVPSNVSQGIQDLGEITQVVVKSFEIGGGGGGGFTPTETQLQAINSGATAEKITQIATNTYALKYTPKAMGMITSDEPEGFVWDGFIWIESETLTNIPCACKIFNATANAWEDGTYEGRAFDTFWWRQDLTIHRNVIVLNFGNNGLIFIDDPGEESLWMMKQNLITDINQTLKPTDTDSLSDLYGTDNKRWTFAKIWEFIKGKFTYDTNYTDAPADTDTLANLDKDTAKIKRITFANLWTWIKGKITSVYYPIGSVVFNMGGNPSANFGGTWELYATGTKALYLDATAETTINEELPDPQLTTASGGSHTHQSQGYYGGGSASKQCMARNKVTSDPTDTNCLLSGGAHTHTIKIGNTLYSGSKVRVDGITICAWKRTA